MAVSSGVREAVMIDLDGIVSTKDKKSFYRLKAEQQPLQ
jgi:hypothetical protein